MNSQVVMLIDLQKCVGCHACAVACFKENDLSPGVFWSRIMTVGPKGEFPNLTMYKFPTLCMHCRDAPCVDGCPTGASYYSEEGMVLIDENKCVGCHYCMILCPYDARKKEPSGVVSKCTFCIERIREGMMPKCVEVCPLKARHMGDISDDKDEVRRTIYKKNAVKLFEDLKTDPSVYYIFP